MKIVIGNDHAAVSHKELVKAHLTELGHEVIDVGIAAGEKADYPDVAEKACGYIQRGEAERGILLCGTGAGMSMSANKMKGIRAGLCSDTFTAYMMRLHNDANVLCFGERVVGAGLALMLVDTFMNTEFEGGRHAGRVAKVMALEGK